MASTLALCDLIVGLRDFLSLLVETIFVAIVGLLLRHRCKLYLFFAFVDLSTGVPMEVTDRHTALLVTHKVVVNNVRHSLILILLKLRTG